MRNSLDAVDYLCTSDSGGAAMCEELLERLNEYRLAAIDTVSEPVKGQNAIERLSRAQIALEEFPVRTSCADTASG